MSTKLALRLRVLVIKVALELVLFIDFLEDIPQKLLRLLFGVSLIIITLIGASGLYVYEQETHNINTILKTLFIHNYETQPLDLSNRYPLLVKNVSLPDVSARSLLIMDVKTNKVLYEFNSKSSLPPASTTKIVTALVSRNLYKLEDTILVPENCTKLDTSKVGYLPGERVSVADLLHALLISSAGDAACTLARGKMPESEFVLRMNNLTLDMGLDSTKFTNPVGLDDYSANHVSSAQDLYKLSIALKNDYYLSQIVQTKEYNLETGTIRRKIFNTNDLLWDVPGTVGIKTGRTYEAGEVLVYEYSSNNVDLIIVVMGSLDRFKDTQALLRWTLESYDFGTVK